MLYRQRAVNVGRLLGRIRGSFGQEPRYTERLEVDRETPYRPKVKRMADVG